MLVFGAIGVILWTGGHDVLAGRISPGDLSAFVFYSVIVAGAVGAVSEVMGDLQRAAGAAERLMELLATDANAHAKSGRLGSNSAMRRFASRVTSTIRLVPILRR